MADVEFDFRRSSDNILHWQERPHVYPFSDKSNTVEKLPSSSNRYITMYNSDFFPKPLSVRRLRPTSIHRFNKPHPTSLFHMNQATNMKVPVVRTKLTLEQLNVKPVSSPLMSNSHRSYRGIKLPSAQKARQIRDTWTIIEGIVPQMHHDRQTVETPLFPSIPRNARLTADRATKITNAAVKPRIDKKQPHLQGNMDSIMRGQQYENDHVHPFLPVKDMCRPALKPLSGRSNAMNVPMWDGAPRREAATTQQIYGRKRKFSSYIDPEVEVVVPNVDVPSSKGLMFKEYTQYPKYAPQMRARYYDNKKSTSRIVHS